MNILFMLPKWWQCFLLMVDLPNLVACLKQTSVFEWYVAMHGFKSKYQKEVYKLKETGLHAQNMITTLGSIVNIGEEAWKTI